MSQGLNFSRCSLHIMTLQLEWWTIMKTLHGSAFRASINPTFRNPPLCDIWRAALITSGLTDNQSRERFHCSETSAVATNTPMKGLHFACFAKWSLPFELVEEISSKWWIEIGWGQQQLLENGRTSGEKEVRGEGRGTLSNWRRSSSLQIRPFHPSPRKHNSTQLPEWGSWSWNRGKRRITTLN